VAAVRAALFRYFLGRRLARYLPGGWVAVLLANPISMRILRSLNGRFRRRRRRISQRRLLPDVR
jgi:hypothetical protein